MENLEQYFKMYDEVMNSVNDDLADEYHYQQLEDAIYTDMQEEYMWYKFEDYMLWKKYNN